MLGQEELSLDTNHDLDVLDNSEDLDALSELQRLNGVVDDFDSTKI